jgi:hypothetical protein
MKAEFTAIIEAAAKAGTGHFARKFPAPTDREKPSFLFIVLLR